MANPNETEIKPDYLWTGDLVPPLDNEEPLEPDPSAPTNPQLDDQGLMIDVYSAE